MAIDPARPPSPHRCHLIHECMDAVVSQTAGQKNCIPAVAVCDPCRRLVHRLSRTER